MVPVNISLNVGNCEQQILGLTDREKLLACKSNSIYNKINDIYVYCHPSYFACGNQS